MINNNKIRNTNKGIIMSFVVFTLLLFSFGFIGAVSPFQSSEVTTEQNYLIEYPKINNGFVNEEIYINAHVLYNNGSALIDFNKSEVNCSLDLYNDIGKEIFSSLMNVSLNNNEYYYMINKSYFSDTTDKYYIINCIDEKGISGFVSIPLNIDNRDVITDNNFKIDFSKTSTIIFLILLIIISIILLFLNYNLYFGLIWFVIGLLMIFSGVNFIMSIIVLGFSIFIITNDN